ncbi:glutathione S-transferase [Simiduia sp. 21SJ11W-1]|uniref:glutathione S-transferase n=1 Tax=Simiduia sp. 21SJ11W-1 TaxID=2909669 RepID=UPI00209D06EB|nr:glutathione S-transferase [Simiduia sp. 21SJ11W-1]UTA47061.1 glutathione S-transferase [Simiduia sp. 21SJ11W-1]
MSAPVLYSFRRCPYAMRARLALLVAGCQVELREVVLRDKPAELRAVSPKATVPVLVLPAGEVIDESRDIMAWAFTQGPGSSYGAVNPALVNAWLDDNDQQFKYWLDRYKYADRYPEGSQREYRTQGEAFLVRLEQQLAATQGDYLLGVAPSWLDIGIMPFVRQFAHVDKAWFNQSPYPLVIAWLERWLASETFLACMKKYPQWAQGHARVYFPPAQGEPLAC